MMLKKPRARHSFLIFKSDGLGLPVASGFTIFPDLCILTSSLYGSPARLIDMQLHILTSADTAGVLWIKSAIVPLPISFRLRLYILQLILLKQRAIKVTAAVVL